MPKKGYTPISFGCSKTLETHINYSSIYFVVSGEVQPGLHRCRGGHSTIDEVRALEDKATYTCTLGLCSISKRLGCWWHTEQYLAPQPGGQRPSIGASEADPGVLLGQVVTIGDVAMECD